jgi:hypothetical protein
MAHLDFVGYFRLFLPSEKRPGFQEPAHIHVVDTRGIHPDAKFWLQGNRKGWANANEAQVAIRDTKTRYRLEAFLLDNHPAFEMCFHWMLNQEINGDIKKLKPHIRVREHNAWRELRKKVVL